VRKQKKGQKEGMQVSLFDAANRAEMAKPVNLYEQPPVQVKPEFVLKPPGMTRQRIVIGSTRSCPHCGQDIRLAPDGTVRCTKCWWWQGLNE